MPVRTVPSANKRQSLQMAVGKISWGEGPEHSCQWDCRWWHGEAANGSWQEPTLPLAGLCIRSSECCRKTGTEDTPPVWTQVTFLQTKEHAFHPIMSKNGRTDLLRVMA